MLENILRRPIRSTRRFLRRNTLFVPLDLCGTPTVLINRSCCGSRRPRRKERIATEADSLSDGSAQEEALADGLENATNPPLATVRIWGVSARRSWVLLLQVGPDGVVDLVARSFGCRC